LKKKKYQYHLINEKKKQNIKIELRKTKRIIDNINKNHKYITNISGEFCLNVIHNTINETISQPSTTNIIHSTINETISQPFTSNVTHNIINKTILQFSTSNITVFYTNKNNNNNINNNINLIHDNNVQLFNVDKEKRTNKKNRAKNKGYKEINTSHVLQLQHIIEHYIVEMNIFCDHCDAKHFNSEKVVLKVIHLTTVAAMVLLN